MRSLRLQDKIEIRLNNNKIMEEVDLLIDLAKSNNSFNTAKEFKQNLVEGSLLHINKIASKALSIPSGDYIVWTTGSNRTALLPHKTKSREVYEDSQSIELFTKDLLKNWNVINKILSEAEEDNEYDDNENEYDNESKKTDDDESRSTARIDMSTVDRNPIVRAMEQHGHTVTSLADAVGVDPPAISRILRSPRSTSKDPGGRNPSIGLAALIANELKMDAEALFPDIFGVPDKSKVSAKEVKGNRGSGKGKKTKASKMWTQGSSD